MTMLGPCRRNSNNKDYLSAIERFNLTKRSIELKADAAHRGGRLSNNIESELELLQIELAEAAEQIVSLSDGSPISNRAIAVVVLEFASSGSDSDIGSDASRALALATLGQFTR